MTLAEHLAPARPAHPAVFMVLCTPFGVVSGFLSVAIGYLLSQAGLSVDEIAALVAASFIPQTWKFLWAPIADTTLTAKRWYVMSCAVSALGIYAIAAMPATRESLPWLYAIALLSSFATTFLAMACESLLAYDTPHDQKGRASGWYQAGNLGGGGLGGGAGLWMAQALPAPWMSGAILAVACFACCLALLFIREPVRMPRAAHYRQDLANVVRDLWSITRSRAGMLGLLICFLPLGTGAAAGLWSAVAKDWSASADTVALVTGVVGGIASAIGCFIGGWACDRMERRNAYALFGFLLALCAIGMAAAPRTEVMYIGFTTIYSLISGLSYAGFTAIVLETIGQGAAATKYNFFASLSNMPIAYMIVVDGWAHTRWGAAGMLYTEAVIGILAIGVFYAVAKGRVTPYLSRRALRQDAAVDE
jgi:MFS transporter, PAT family, beta-lactamase induction signal transducer AmpG